MITGFYTGLLALMLVFLSARVIRRRMKYRVGVGDGGIQDLTLMIRSHGNFTETVPALLFILFLLEESGFDPMILHVYGMLAVLGRLLHLFGLSSSPTQSVGRFWGTAITLTLLATGGLILIGAYLTGEQM